VITSVPSGADELGSEAPLDRHVDDSWRGGSRSRGLSDLLIARPTSEDGENVSPLRPAAEWLPREPPDQGPPTREEVAARVKEFLKATSVIVHRARDGKLVAVEARGAVDGAVLLGENDATGVFDEFPGDDWLTDAPRLALVVRHDASGAGRPHDVAAAIGYEARWIVRSALGLEGEPRPNLERRD
jgi:hypothetical protein